MQCYPPRASISLEPKPSLLLHLCLHTYTLCVFMSTRVQLHNIHVHWPVQNCGSWVQTPNIISWSESSPNSSHTLKSDSGECNRERLIGIHRTTLDEFFFKTNLRMYDFKHILEYTYGEVESAKEIFRTKNTLQGATQSQQFFRLLKVHFIRTIHLQIKKNLHTLSLWSYTLIKFCSSWRSRLSCETCHRNGQGDIMSTIFEVYHFVNSKFRSQIL